MEHAVFCLTQEQVTVICAGRTDTGVHACGQVVHVDLSKKWDTDRLQAGLNFYLKEKGISVWHVYPCTLHARFDAQERHYAYHILNRRSPSPLLKDRVWHMPVSLDLCKMQQGCALLMGHHNFNAFRSAACQAKNPIRTLTQAKITSQPSDREAEKRIIIQFAAPAFLHNQVRIMVGTLVQIGTGKMAPIQISKALESGLRHYAGPTAPAEGLYFMKVIYNTK